MAEPFLIQPLQAPAPGKGRLFVNRKPEIAFIDEKVQRLMNDERGLGRGPRLMVITVFWGTFGVGKSWLLKELKRLYQRGSAQGQRARPTVAVRLDCEPDVNKAIWDGKALKRNLFLHELAKQLAEETGLPAPLEPDGALAGLTRDFVRYVTDISSSYTPLIIIDSLDRVATLDQEAMQWLETDVFEGLALTDRVLMIFGSRSELRRWDRFHVRRRVDLYQLKSFDSRTAGAIVRANEAAGVALHGKTFGHPLATEQLGSWLEKHDLSLDRATAAEVEAKLDDQVMRDFLREFSQHVMKVSEEVPDHLVRLARRASVLRSVNVTPLRCLAEETGLETQGRGDDHYMQQITDMQALHLLYFDDATTSWTFDTTLRRLLARELEIDDLATYLAAHHAAYDYYKERLETVPENLVQNLPAAAYHAAHCAGGNAGPVLRDFLDWYAAFGREGGAGEPEQWLQLGKALREDGELQEALGPAVFETLAALTEAHSASLAPAAEEE